MGRIAEIIATSAGMGATVKVEVTATDLAEFAVSVVEDTIRHYEAKRSDDTEYLTTRETATACKCSKSKIDRLARLGLLVPDGKNGHSRLYSRGQINRFLANK